MVVQPGETRSVTFQLRPVAEGRYSGDVDVCNPNQDFQTLLVDDKDRLGGKLVLQTHKFFGSIEDCYAGTRGIDIGAMEFVLQQILEHRDAGAAVLLISTELEELFAVSDRILVMYEGQIVGEVSPKEELIEEVGLMMAGRKAG